MLGLYTWLGGAVVWALASLAWARWTGQNAGIAIALGAGAQPFGLLALVMMFMSQRSRGFVGGNSDYRSNPARFDETFGDSSESYGPTGEFNSTKVARDHQATIRVLLGVSMASLIGALFFPAYYIFSGDFTELQPQLAFSTGLEFWVFISLVGMAIAIFAISRPLPRLVFVLLGWLGVWWFFLAVAAMTNREAFLTASQGLFELPDLFTGGYGDGGDFVDVFVSQLGEFWYFALVGGLALIVAAFIDVARRPSHQFD